MSSVRIKIFDGVCSLESLEWYMNKFLIEKKVHYVDHSISVSRITKGKGEFKGGDSQSYAGSIAYRSKNDR